jgi:hypothetical protein
MTPAQVQQSQLQELYERDFCRWAEHMAIFHGICLSRRMDA